jgi:hypothetical protein
VPGPAPQVRVRAVVAEIHRLGHRLHRP